MRKGSSCSVRTQTAPQFGGRADHLAKTVQSGCERLFNHVAVRFRPECIGYVDPPVFPDNVMDDFPFAPYSYGKGKQFSIVINQLFLNFFLLSPARPIRPEPKSSMVEGSGMHSAPGIVALAKKKLPVVSDNADKSHVIFMLFVDDCGRLVKSLIGIISAINSVPVRFPNNDASCNSAPSGNGPIPAPVSAAINQKNQFLS